MKGQKWSKGQKRGSDEETGGERKEGRNEGAKGGRKIGRDAECEG